jgi:hypothetical protein
MNRTKASYKRTDRSAHFGIEPAWNERRLVLLEHLSIGEGAGVLVSQVWRRLWVQPHRSRSYMASDDPEFEEKVADIIGLFLRQPVHGSPCVETYCEVACHCLSYYRSPI